MNQSKQWLLTLLEIDVVIVQRIVVQKLISFALAESVEEVMIVRRNLIM